MPKSFRLFTAALLFVSTSSLSAMAASKGTYFKWSKEEIGNSVCAEWTPEGFPIRQVSNSICRKLRPTHYGWSKEDIGNSVCAEWTPDNFPVRQVPQSYCR